MSKNTLIVIIVVLVLLGGGYFLMKPKTVEPTPLDVTPPETTETMGPKSLTYTLNPDEKNTEVAQSGTAVLEETDTGLKVTITVEGYESDVPQPAHIHEGICPEVGKVVYPLESLVDGTSTTMLEGVTIADLENQLPLGINVHKSAPEAGVYTSCADLEF